MSCYVKKNKEEVEPWESEIEPPLEYDVSAEAEPDWMIVTQVPVKTRAPASPPALLDAGYTGDGLPEINFGVAFSQAVKIFSDQSLMSAAPQEITLENMELTRAKADSFLDAINNIINISHLKEIIVGDELKFKRKAEMDVMNVMLDSYHVAAVAGKKSLEFLVSRLDIAMEAVSEGSFPPPRKSKSKKNAYGMEDFGNGDGTGNGDETDEGYVQRDPLVEVTRVQQAYGVAVDNLTRITSGLARVIQLERASGSRPWGNLQSRPRTIGYVKGLSGGLGGSGDEADSENVGVNLQSPRDLSSEELIEIAHRKRKEELGRHGSE